MATLRVKDLKKGSIYRETLSGHRMRVTMVVLGAGGTPHAICTYYNQVTGRFVRQVKVYDGELEAIKNEGKQ